MSLIVSIPIAMFCVGARANETTEEISEDKGLSQEFLAFFAEYSNIDDETFDLLVYHGQEDSRTQTPESEQKVTRDGGAVSEVQ